jgi:hypothetical protein
MIAHCVSVNVMRIKATSHLVTLNHFDTDLGIPKRQQALVLQLHICADFSMCNGSGSLVLAPPS